VWRRRREKLRFHGGGRFQLRWKRWSCVLEASAFSLPVSFCLKLNNNFLFVKMFNKLERKKKVPEEKKLKIKAPN
jgi:hypothetical protein